VAEERDGGAVHGEAAHGHGFFVRLPDPWSLIPDP